MCIRERERRKEERKSVEEQPEQRGGEKDLAALRRSEQERERERVMREGGGSIQLGRTRAQVVGGVVVLGSLRTRESRARQSDADRVHVDIDGWCVRAFVLARGVIFRLA